MQSKPLKVLFIGPLPPPIGGTSVSFESLTQKLSSRDNVMATIINTSGVRGKFLKGIGRSAGLVYSLIRKISCTDVVTLHSTTSGLHIIGSVVSVLSRFFRKPLIVRKFGGTDYRDYGACRKGIVRWVLRRTDLYLAETKMLVKAAKQDGIKQVAWYPNNRPLLKKEKLRVRKRKCCRRFVYLGHIRPGKGINEIIMAGERFGEDITVDVYGQFYDGLSEANFEGLKRVRYCGMVFSDKVLETLEQYDAFLLPTYHVGEGYPGVVLEAYQAELPVICTRWRAMPEIVDKTCGIFVKVKDVDSLYGAMKRLTEDDQLFERLHRGVHAQQGKFSTEAWSDLFVEYCRALVGRK